MDESTAISVIIPTRNRAPHLRRLLGSLERVAPPPVRWEVVIADNGSTDETSAVLQEWRRHGERRTAVRVPEPGKSRAVNAAIARSSGGLLAFLDDDVVVEEDWLVELWRYFEENDCAAAQGAVAWPREATEDRELTDLLHRYRTLEQIQEGPTGEVLTGVNMAVRRHTLGVTGAFDERLGPGAFGLGEDRDLSQRIHKLGGRIGYIDRARVVHTLDRSVLTEEYFREHHRSHGRGRFTLKQNGMFSSILPNIAKNAVGYVLFSAMRNEPRRYRAKGRLYHYFEMFRLRVRSDEASRRAA